MWKVLMISDSHGNNDVVLAAMKKAAEFDAVIHLGDVGTNYLELENKCPKPFYLVRGNCDYDYSLKQVIMPTFGPHKFYCTHGHLSGVSGGLNILRYQAMEAGCTIAAFGHIHVPVWYEPEQEGDPYIVNPGSISRPRQEDRKKTFAMLTLADDGSVSCRFDYI